jgi:hypothetical protein
MLGRAIALEERLRARSVTGAAWLDVRERLHEPAVGLRRVVAIAMPPVAGRTEIGERVVAVPGLATVRQESLLSVVTPAAG